MVVGRWRTDIEVLASGATYADEVIAVVEVRDGCVMRFSEYFNPDSLPPPPANFRGLKKVHSTPLPRAGRR